MSPWEAIVLGLVEGLTEFLPVSSTGHLILTQHLLGLPSTPAIQAFHICVQAGAIAAVLAVFLSRVRRILAGLVGRDALGLRLGLKLALAFAPAATVGLALDDWIEARLFGLWPITSAWFVGGLLLVCVPLLRDGRPQGGVQLESLSWSRALGIGLFQCLALLPGTSRSLATIAGGLFLGLSGAAAVEFSLLLGFLTLAAAAGYKAVDQGPAMLSEIGAVNLALGFAAAFVSAWLAVGFLVKLLARGGLAAFGWYRMLLALVVVAALLAGWLSP